MPPIPTRFIYLLPPHNHLSVFISIHQLCNVIYNDSTNHKAVNDIYLFGPILLCVGQLGLVRHLLKSLQVISGITEPKLLYFLCYNHDYILILSEVFLQLAFIFFPFDQNQ